MAKNVKKVEVKITPDIEIKRLIKDISYLEQQIINTRNLAEYLQEVKERYSKQLQDLKNK